MFVYIVFRRTGPRVVAYLESGKRVVGDALLYTMGRQGNTDSMALDKAGLKADGRGLLEVQVNTFCDISSAFFCWNWAALIGAMWCGHSSAHQCKTPCAGAPRLLCWPHTERVRRSYLNITVCPLSAVIWFTAWIAHSVEDTLTKILWGILWWRLLQIHEYDLDGSPRLRYAHIVECRIRFLSCFRFFFFLWGVFFYLLVFIFGFVVIMYHCGRTFKPYFQLRERTG